MEWSPDSKLLMLVTADAEVLIYDAGKQALLHPDLLSFTHPI